MTGGGEPRPLAVELGGDPPAILHAERLRDGRVALGTRLRGSDGEWEAGEMLVLPPGAAAALAGWLAPVVEAEWDDTVRDRLRDQLRTAQDLYGAADDGPRRLAEGILAEIPPRLLARALVLLAASIGPATRSALVDALNRTRDFSEEAMLRRRLAEEGDAFAFVVAAAALFRVLDPEAESLPRPG